MPHHPYRETSCGKPCRNRTDGNGSRRAGFIVPGLLLMMIFLTMLLASRFGEIDHLSGLHQAVKRQQMAFDAVARYEEAVLSIDPRSGVSQADRSSGIAWRVSLHGGRYNLAHALQWIATKPTASIDHRQTAALRRVLQSCGFDPELAVTLLDKAKMMLEPAAPLTLLHLEDDEGLSRDLLLRLQRCVVFNPYMARFEIMSARAEIGASLLGISIPNFIVIADQIERGLINSRSVLKQELKKVAYDEDVALNSISLSLTPRWWTIEMLDDGAVFASFTIVERQDSTRRIVASHVHWMPDQLSEGQQGKAG